MNLFNNQSWDDLTHPVRWDKGLRQAMGELEARLPGMLGAGIWLHRNVSRYDLEQIDEPGAHPPMGKEWPLMYLVCRYRKALLGFQLVKRERCNSGGMPWKTTDSVAKGILCFRYVIDAEEPDVDLDRIMKDICVEARKIKKPLWRCSGNPVHFGKEGRCLTERGLVKEEAGVWLPTERGEDCGLMTLFTVKQDGKTTRELRWSPSTWKALTGNEETGPIPFQMRVDRLERGLASCDAYAAEAVRHLAEMPLKEYFRSCPEVSLHDMYTLRMELGLWNTCLFRSAATALYRRLLQAESKAEKDKLMPLLKLLALPIAKLDETERRLVVKKFRKGPFF